MPSMRKSVTKTYKLMKKSTADILKIIITSQMKKNIMKAALMKKQAKNNKFSLNKMKTKKPTMKKKSSKKIE